MVVRFIMQQMNITTPSPPTAQNFNSEHNTFCTLAVNLCPNRHCSMRRVSECSFRSNNVYTASSQHEPGVRSTSTMKQRVKNGGD